MSNQHLKSEPLTAEAIEVRVWGFVVIVVTLILCFIVVALLYSVTFVTQPIKSMAPIDQAYTKMLNDIVLLIVGGIGGVMTKRAVGSGARALGAPQPPTPTMCQPMGFNGSQGGFNQSYTPSGHTWTSPSGALPAWVNPELDESWTPGPPPTTPPDHQEPDEVREEIAKARQEAD